MGSVTEIIRPESSLSILAMKVVTLVLLGISCMVLANKDAPKYSCPEIDVDFHGSDITCGSGCGVPGVPTWEDCGTICQHTDDCRFWTWASDDNKCFLKSSDTGLGLFNGLISGAKDCPES